MSRGRSFALAAVLVLAPLGACNGLTGADGLDVAGGAGGAAPVPMVDAAGVTITQISIYQGVKHQLMPASTPAIPVPIVAGRDALVRVFVTIQSAYNKGPVVARLYVNSGLPFEVTQTVTGTSTEGDLTSTFDFDVPGSFMKTGLQYRVELVQSPNDSPGNYPAAHYPEAAGTLDPIPVDASGSILKILMVPIAYGADGSNRKPDLTPATVQLYQDHFRAIYPIPDVKLTVRAPYAWPQAVGPDGTGWMEMLDAIVALRAQDNPPQDLYYYGVFDPAADSGTYCGSGCVAGLGMIGGPSDASSRAAIGLGFPDSARGTAVHEIGHTHGRHHAPCGGAMNVDPLFPYSNASIGAWGYDLGQKTLFSPQSTTDMMGYCDLVWVSDYTYSALFDRLKFVNGARIVYPPESLDRTYERVRVVPGGKAVWLSPVTLHEPPLAEDRSIVVEEAGGPVTLTGHYFAYDHLEGGVILFPVASPAARGMWVDVSGKPVHVTR